MFYIIWRIFSPFKYFLGKKTQTNDSDVGGPNPDPLMILNLEPGSNPDPLANPDPEVNLDPVWYRSDCRICVTNPDQFSYLITVINPDPSKNPVMNPDQVTTPDTISKPDLRTKQATDPGLAPNPFTNQDSKLEPDRESEPERE
jgi:hypothetical protein